MQRQKQKALKSKNKEKCEKERKMQIHVKEHVKVDLQMCTYISRLDVYVYGCFW